MARKRRGTVSPPTIFPFDDLSGDAGGAGLEGAAGEDHVEAEGQDPEYPIQALQGI